MALVLNVLGRVVALEPEQAALLDAICNDALVDAADVSAVVATQPKWTTKKKDGPSLFGE